MNIKVIKSKKVIPVKLDFVDNKIEVRFEYFAPMVEEIKAMKGAKFDPDQRIWTIDNCRRNLFSFEMLMKTKRVRDRYLCEQKNYTPKYPYEQSPLWVHQLDMYQFEKTRQRCLLGAEPRTGKTRPTLQVFYETDYPKAVFVTTKSAKLGVYRELDKWFKGHITAYPSKKWIDIITYNKFVSMINSMQGEKLDIFWIFDECHRLKTVGTQRTKAAMVLSESLEDVYRDAEFCLGLSGTPAPKNPCDWWSQCEVIRSGYIKEGDYKKFEKRYGVYKPWDGSTPVWNRFEGWDKEEVAKLSNRLKGLVKIYFQKDCSDLPPIREEIVRLEPSKALLRVAKMIIDTSPSALVARARLRQISDGFEYTKEYSEDKNKMIRTGYNFVGSPKIEKLEELLDSYSEVGRLVVYAALKGSLEIIRKTCQGRGWYVLQIDGEGAVVYKPNGEQSSNHELVQMVLGEMDNSTDTGTIEKLVVVAEPLSGGTGLEFSSSPAVIYYSNGDSGEAKFQSIRRPYSENMNKKRGLVVYEFILLPTDELILNKLKEKQDLQELSMGEMSKCLNFKLEEIDNENSC